MVLGLHEKERCRTVKWRCSWGVARPSPPLLLCTFRWPIEERTARRGSRRGPEAQSGRASTLVPRSPVCASLSSPGSDGSFSPRDIVGGVSSELEKRRSADRGRGSSLVRRRLPVFAFFASPGSAGPRRGAYSGEWGVGHGAEGSRDERQVQRGERKWGGQ